MVLLLLRGHLGGTRGCWDAWTWQVLKLPPATPRCLLTKSGSITTDVVLHGRPGQVVKLPCGIRIVVFGWDSRNPSQAEVSGVICFKKHPFRRAAGVDRNVERVKSLMAQCVSHIYREHDVHDLCSAWPRRLVELVAADGERLKY